MPLFKWYKSYSVNNRELDEPEATRELIVLLGNRLLHHVIEEDQKYAA